MFQHRMVRKVAPECVTKADECSFTYVQLASVTILLHRFICTTCLLISSTDRWSNFKLSGKVFKGLHHGICLTNAQWTGQNVRY